MTDCPIANAFQPELRAVHQAYANRGIDCYMVYCASRLTVTKVTTHVSQYQVELPAILADSQGIIKTVGTTATPDAIIVNGSGAVCYRGMINTLYVRNGKTRQQTSKPYLRDEYDEFLEKGIIKTTSTKPTVCFIRYSAIAHE
jgi:hypothetical protein